MRRMNGQELSCPERFARSCLNDRRHPREVLVSIKLELEKFGRTGCSSAVNQDCPVPGGKHVLWNPLGADRP